MMMTWIANFIYVKNLLRFFNKNIAREKIGKSFKEFCYIGLLKIVII